MSDQSWADFFQQFQMPPVMDGGGMWPEQPPQDPMAGGGPMGPEQPLAPPPGMGMPPQGLADAMRRYMNPEPPQGQQQGGMSKFLMGRSKPPEPPDWAKPDWHDNLGKNNPYSQLAPEIVGPEAQGRTPHYNPFGGGLTEHGFGAGRVEHPPLKRQPLIPGVDILEPNPMLPPSPKISRGFR